MAAKKAKKAKKAKSGSKLTGQAFEGAVTPTPRVLPTAQVDFLDTLVRAVVAEYERDPSKPSVLVSMLNDGHFYVSIARYERAYGEGKVVVCNARHADLAQALKLLSQSWLSKQTAKRKLVKMVECFAPDPWGE